MRIFLVSFVLLMSGCAGSAPPSTEPARPFVSSTHLATEPGSAPVTPDGGASAGDNTSYLVFDDTGPLFGVGATPGDPVDCGTEIVPLDGTAEATWTVEPPMGAKDATLRQLNFTLQHNFTEPYQYMASRHVFWPDGTTAGKALNRGSGAGPNAGSRLTLTDESAPLPWGTYRMFIGLCFGTPHTYWFNALARIES